MKRFVAVGALMVAAALAVFAQGGRSARFGADDESIALRSTSDAVVRSSTRSKGAAASPRATGSSDWELWRNLTIGPGQSVTLHSDLDFSTAGTARVSFRSRNNDLPDLRMDAYWAVPQAEFFNVAEVVTGQNFPYRNVGGVTFTTYGSQFRLRLTNTGGTTIFLSQIIIFSWVL